MVERDDRASAAATGGSAHAAGGIAPAGHAPAGGAGQEEDIFRTEACWSISSGDLLRLHTGDWRTERPVFVKEKCNACGFCYIFCPIQCVVDDEDGIHYAVDMDYCKGCGVCAKECPKDAIVMTPEGDFDDCRI